MTSSALAEDSARRERLSLEQGWLLCECEPGSPPPAGEDGRWLPVTAPMPVAAALRERGEWSLDGAPLALDAKDWWYRCAFDRPECASHERLVLRFEGLATLAQLWLNGQPMGQSDNMFLAHEFDLTDALRDSGNELLLCFGSLDKHLAPRRPRPRWRVPMLAQQQLRWVRTTLLGRTPGWSPAAPVVGPWRAVALHRRNALDGAQVMLDARPVGDMGVVQCTVRFAPGSPLPEALTLQIEGHGAAHALPLGAQGGGIFEGEMRVPQPRLWWPHTHGEPALYAARLRAAGGSERVLDAVGFRSIAVDREEGGFRIEVNGTAVFCRGAVWTPLDALGLRSSADECSAAVAQVRAAGMNMLRVAGTMVYEEDHFYRACDEQGVLVWQDFMFANMDYPAQDEAFMASVLGEAGQQLRRLRSRPCLAVLCGNSEVAQQAAMWGAPREQWYPQLFESTLAQLCAQLAPAVPYWPSSAHGGALPFQADAGTTSYYGVGAYLRPLQDARRAGVKFATECLAFSNVPSQSCIERMPGGLANRVHHPQWKARVPRDLGAGWDFEDVRDHYLQSLFALDPQKLRHAEHERYLALSRLVTGELMAAAFAEWRRPGSGCGGALVLFLRDLWAGAGWGLLDERGEAKAAFHCVKRVLQPLAVLLSDEGGNGLAVHLVNERERQAQVRLELNAWRGGAVEVAQGAADITLAGRSARTVPAQELLDHFMDLGYAYRFGPPPCDAVRVGLVGADGARLAQAFHFPAGLPALLAIEPVLGASARMLDERTAELTVEADKLALGVHFDIPGYQASDEHFHLAPRSPVKVRLVRLRDAPAREPRGTVFALNAPAGVTLRAAG